MARRFEVSDEQWEKLAPYFGNKQGKMGRPQADNRKLFNGVLWVLRTGAPWQMKRMCSMGVRLRSWFGSV